MTFGGPVKLSAQHSAHTHTYILYKFISFLNGPESNHQARKQPYSDNTNNNNKTYTLRMFDSTYTM